MSIETRQQVTFVPLLVQERGMMAEDTSEGVVFSEEQQELADKLKTSEVELAAKRMANESDIKPGDDLYLEQKVLNELRAEAGDNPSKEDREGLEAAQKILDGIRDKKKTAVMRVLDAFEKTKERDLQKREERAQEKDQEMLEMVDRALQVHPEIREERKRESQTKGFREARRQGREERGKRRERGLARQVESDEKQRERDKQPWQGARSRADSARAIDKLFKEVMGKDLYRRYTNEARTSEAEVDEGGFTEE